MSSPAHTDPTKCFKDLWDAGVLRHPRFTTADKIVDQLHPVQGLGISPSLAQHYQGLRFMESSPHRLNGGAHLSFRVDFDYTVGINIQGAFVREILRLYFPKAEFLGRKQTASEGRSVIELTMNDFNLMDREPTDINMLLAKTANGSAASIEHTAIRGMFGIPEDVKTTSIYFGQQPHLFEVVEAIAKDSDQNLIFASGGGHMSSGETSSIESVLRKRYEDTHWVIRLSEIEIRGMNRWLEIAEDAGRRIIVVNDKEGYLSHLHAAADVAVILGPYNHMEALQVGTPTLVYRDAQFDDQERFQDFQNIQPHIPNQTQMIFYLSETYAAMDTLRQNGRIEFHQRPFMRPEVTNAFLRDLEGVVSRGLSETSSRP